MARKMISEVDECAAEELRLYIVNDGDLYRQRTEPIQANVRRRRKAGTYDPAKAVKLWRYLVDDGARKYVREFDAPGAKWGSVFSVATREAVAAELARDFEAECALNECLNEGCNGPAELTGYCRECIEDEG